MVYVNSPFPHFLYHIPQMSDVLHYRDSVLSFISSFLAGRKRHFIHSQWVWGYLEVYLLLRRLSTNIILTKTSYSDAAFHKILSFHGVLQSFMLSFFLLKILFSSEKSGALSHSYWSLLYSESCNPWSQGTYLSLIGKQLNVHIQIYC